MSFFQKNRSIIVIILMVGFLLVIVSVFVSGITGSNSNPTPTEDFLSQQLNLATSTNNLTLSTPRPGSTQLQAAPLTSAVAPGVSSSSQTPTQTGPQDSGSPSATQESSPANVGGSGTDAPPPPTVDFAVTDDGPPGTDFPPPLTFVPPPTETPPPGNGPPPGS